MTAELDDALRKWIHDLLMQRCNCYRQSLIEQLVNAELQTGSRLSSPEKQWGDASTLNQ